MGWLDSCNFVHTKIFYEKSWLPHSRIELLAFSLQEKRSTTELEGLWALPPHGMFSPIWETSILLNVKRT
jgi:hypothetical protein